MALSRRYYAINVVTLRRVAYTLKQSQQQTATRSRGSTQSGLVVWVLRPNGFGCRTLEWFLSIVFSSLTNGWHMGRLYVGW